MQLARARWRVLSNYSGMTRTTVQLRLKSGLLMTNQIREFWYSCDYYKNWVLSNESIKVQLPPFHDGNQPLSTPLVQHNFVSLSHRRSTTVSVETKDPFVLLQLHNQSQLISLRQFWWMNAKYSFVLGHLLTASPGLPSFPLSPRTPLKKSNKKT